MQNHALQRFSRAGIISAADLHDWINHAAPENQPVILDATFTLPNDPQDAYATYQGAHIASAQWFDIKKDFADPDSAMPNMLCGPEQFAAAMGRLGIDQDRFVVIYGQSGMAMGPARAWWTLKAYGHDNVAVLDGGLPAWKAQGFALSSHLSPVQPAKYPLPKTASPSHIIGIAELQDQSGAILDARPADRFSGRSPEPRAEIRAGHIPGSANIPASALIDPSTGRLLTAAQLQALFSAHNPESEKPVTLTCGSGVTACMLALALHHLGQDNWQVYDGSWTEWGHINSGQEITTQG